MKRAALLMLAAMAPAPALADGDGASVTVVISGLRTTHGVIQACLTARAATFPECDKDPAARRLTVPAGNGPVLVFRHVRPGSYAVSLFHDQNANGRLDKTLGIPREGYGFSRNAPVRFGPPSFADARFAVAGADVTMPITVRYLL